MVTRDEELKWAYLLDPCFELTNSAGKPLTDGYIEVYIAGSRNKYYCASDFNGTLHPFQIPLDSLGSNIVLADPDNAYDVYVYNRFGSLVMSRYNVTPADGGAVISNTERINELEELMVSAVTGLQGQIDDINDELENKKDKQEEYSVYLTPTQTVSAIIQDENGVIQVITQDIDLPEEVPNVNIVSPASTISITEIYDPETNRKTFELDISDLGRLEYGQYMNVYPVTDSVVLSRIKGNLDVTDQGKVQLHAGNSYHITVRGTYTPNEIVNTEEALEYVETVSNSRIKVDVDNTIAGPQHFELSYDLFKLDSDTDYLVAFNSSNGTITELTVEIHSLTNISVIDTSGHLVPGWGIEIVSGVISVDPNILNDYTTHTELIEAVTSVTAMIPEAQVQSDWNEEDSESPAYIQNKPDLTEFVDRTELVEMVTAVTSDFSEQLEDKQDVLEPGQYISIENNVISATGLQPEGDYATRDDLQDAMEAVTALIPEAQVQSDWNEEDDTSPAYIQNKPNLDEYATDVEVIEIVTSVSSVLQDEIDNIPEQVQADWEQDNPSAVDYIRNKPDLDVYATLETVTAVSSVLQNEIDNIPEQVQSDWDQTDDTQKDYIKNKPNLDEYATDVEVMEIVTSVSSVLQNEIDNIPAQVQSDWEEADTESPAYIQNKPDLDIYATIETVSGVSSVLVELIDNVSAAVPEAQVQADWAETDDTKKSFIQNKPDLDVYATIETVTAVSSTLQNEIDNIPEQVQSDWTETDTADPAYILHKPEVQDIYAGQNITLTETASGLEIAADGTDTSTVSAIAEAYMEAVTAMIPEAQVQSDWTESDTADPSYIKNKPTPKTLVAGNGIQITDTVTSVEISAAVTGIEGYVTEVELVEAISGITGTGDYGQFYCNTASGACVMGRIKGTIDVTNDGKIKLEKGKSYHMSVRGCYRQSTASNTEDTIGFIEYVTNNTIQINVDRTVTSGQYFDLGFDVYNLSHDVEYYVFFTGVNNSGVMQDVFVDVHTILGGGSGGNGGGGGGGTEYNQGWGIVITNNSISVNPNIIPDVSNLATKDEVSLAIATATGAQINPNWNETSPLSKAYIQNKPSEMYLMGGENVEINIVGASAIISASVSGGGSGTEYTAGDYIDITDDTISVTGLDNSNIFWAQLSGSSPTPHADILAAYNAGKRILGIWNANTLPLTYYINNRFYFSGLFPNTSNPNLSGNINVEVRNNNRVFDYAPSYLQADWNTTNSSYSSFIKNKPDLSTYATVASVTAVVDSIPEIELNGDDQVTAIDGHTLAGGGGTQVQSDWTEDNTSDPSYIQNKPEEQMLIAGNNVEITIDGASAIISAQGGGGGATYSAGQNISISNQNVIAVTGLAQADWNSSSGASQILNKPTEKNLVAGANVTITESGDDVVVQTTEIASGLQLVAGDNVTIAVSGNNLIVNAAKGVTKTLLYTGSSTDSRKGSFTLSQSGYNFDRLEMTLIDVDNYVIKQICEMPADNLTNSNGTRGSSFNSITSGTQTWFKAMNWQLNSAGTTLTYWVDEIATSGNTINSINRSVSNNRPIMLRIYGVKD